MDKNLKIGVVGLGLIGGSIFKELCALGFDVIGVSKSAGTIEKAKKYSFATDSLQSLNDCDIVFVCTPMNKTISTLDELENILNENTIVTDVCSLKRFLQSKNRPQKYKFKFIPGHPMAGSEFSGFDNSIEGLFKEANWVLTPLDKNLKEDIKKLENIIKSLGANPVFTTPEAHDEAVALISHMPMLISQAIFKAACCNELALKIASSGFRDMTRLAISNEEMAKDMINLNSDNIQNALLKLYSSVGDLLNKDYFEQICEIKKQRKEMFKN
ncbi:MAG TPA: prephenate dehydrogenase/arogenate dehydrogenase family protein [Candidatus Gastranaerophilaceae bacterium]|nr:prephenate dehydrogenase/arogenate dehydrogenase family protein [Candidatus Gastranaerophilaceae bacterium]HPT42109.1 prephenate dehydrogenase/arogenate dehydrogenase family protein [Candidatus Gastranaerophilaceae bacterium]